MHSVLSQLVYACQGLEVDTVICDGAVLLDQGLFQTLDPATIYAEVERIRLKLARELALHH
jgi:cytosine/adenosine deaminase-related metal-dependent hydrolase